MRVIVPSVTCFKSKGGMVCGVHLRNGMFYWRTYTFSWLVNVEVKYIVLSQSGINFYHEKIYSSCSRRHLKLSTLKQNLYKEDMKESGEISFCCQVGREIDRHYGWVQSSFTFKIACIRCTVCHKHHFSLKY